MRTDFDNLQDGDRVMLFPNDANPLHKRATAATYSSGYFYCDGSSPTDGPDYYMFSVRYGVWSWPYVMTEPTDGPDYYMFSVRYGVWSWPYVMTEPTHWMRAPPIPQKAPNTK